MKCPKCGETTNQDMRAWSEKWTKYRCGHCKETYKAIKEADK